MKAHTFVPLLFALLTVLGCSSGNMVYSDALKTLDKTIASMEKTARLKEEKADSLRMELSMHDDLVEKYAVGKKLYKFYIRTDVDSAMAYARLKERFALNSGDRDLMFDAAIDLAERHNISGTYTSAMDIMSSMDTSGISEVQRNAYYNLLITAHFGLYKTDRDPIRKDILFRKTNEYIRMIPQSADQARTYSIDNAIQEGHPERALPIIYDTFGSGTKDEMALKHYYLAKIYREEGDTDNEIMHLAISANYDMSEHVVSRALINLSRLLFEKGDKSHAFKYLLVAFESAKRADARIAMEEANKFLPQTIVSYETLKQKESKMLVWGIILSAIFILILALSLVRINGDRVKIRKMQKEIREENTHISEMNAKLEQQIVRIKESNDIKDTYIGQYMSMFSKHIDSLERYRSSLRIVAKSQNIQDIQMALRDDKPIDEERNALFNEFDESFLYLFPNFVEEFNSLLREECRIGQNLKPKKLTNELRIFALIRLGISNSATIARFLKKSNSTVYNYRVKMRNGAISDRDNFEKQIMGIGCIR